MITKLQICLIFISHPFCHWDCDLLLTLELLTIYHLLSTVSRDIRSQEISLQWHLDINIHVWITFKLMSTMSAKNNPKVLSNTLNVFFSPASCCMLCMYLLAFVCVWVKGMLMRVLGIPPLTRDTWCCLVDFTAVILPAAAETVGLLLAGALALLDPHLSWRVRASWRRNK